MFLAGTEGSDAYMKEIVEERLSLSEIFREFSTCRPPLAELLEKLPPLQPRFYSASSSPLAVQDDSSSSSSSQPKPNRFRFAFSVVDYKTPRGRRRRGLCTSWLQSLCLQSGLLRLDDAKSEELGSADQSTKSVEQIDKSERRYPEIALFPRPTRDFVVPLDLSRPLVMVGPGTGVAPFIGFLQHRLYLTTKTADDNIQNVNKKEREGGKGSGVDKGFSWLFFGCRYEKKDFIYKDELECLLKEGVLSRLSTAFSRDAEEVVYVQHRMVEYGSDLYSLFHAQNGLLFVCGDAKGMAKGVLEAMEQIYRVHGGLAPDAAKAAVTALMQEKRLLMDVW